MYCIYLLIDVRCKMPDDNRLYFECDRCEDWFHPHCQGLGHMSQKQIQRATLCCGPCTEKPSKRRRLWARSTPKKATQTRLKPKHHVKVQGGLANNVVIVVVLCYLVILLVDNWIY